MQDHTLLSVDMTAQLVSLLNMNHRDGRGLRYFTVESSLEDQVVSLRITLQNKDRTFVYPVEARMLYEENNISPNDAALFLADFIDSYFEEYFNEDENSYVPIDWATYESDEKTFQLRGQVINELLEREADALLARASKPSQEAQDLH